MGDDTMSLPFRTLSLASLTLLAFVLVGGLIAQEPVEDSVYSADVFELGDGQPPPGMPGMADVLDDAALAGPDWAALFDADGTPRDDYPDDGAGNPVGNGIPDYQELFNGQWVVFSADDVSLGSEFEGTALYLDGRVYNSVVDADHDIGNAYVYSTESTIGNLVLYAGAERLGSGDSHLELEFNQDHFRLGHGGYGRGEPWEVDGERVTDDVLVVVSFTGGALGTIEVSRWDGAAWAALDSFSGEGCNVDETLCAVCNSTVVDGGPWENHDTDGDPEQISANRFVEVGVNVGALLGIQPSYTTVRLRTPQDTAFGYFAEGN
jgi:hypothetical protein